MNNNFNTPILFIIFNRLDTAQQVFNAIREVKPRQMFIAADGPRLDVPSDKEKCEAARELIKQVDWNCDVKTLFRDENLGCGMGPASAITWFFENVEQGIILEDDCLPNKAFFIFCEQMLEMYKNDQRIMHISGDNYQFGKQRGDGDYYFSKLNHIWGWATWKRAWKYYDFNIRYIDLFIENKYIRNIFNNKKRQKKWINIFVKNKKVKADAWDYQWTYTMWSQNGLAILPNKNLVKNIGLGENSTHTAESNKLFKINNDNADNSNDFLVKKHPLFVIRDYEADLYSRDIMMPNILIRILNKLKKIF